MGREEIIKLSTRISEIRVEIKKLTELQRELRKLEAQLDRVLVGESNPPVQMEKPGTSITDQIVALIGGHPERSFSAEDVQKDLGTTNLNSIRSALSKLVGLGKVVKAGRGQYRARREEEHSMELKEAV